LTNYRGKIDAPVLLSSLTPSTLLVATDSSALHVYDLRSDSRTFSSTKPAATYNPHEDYISSLTPLPSQSTSASANSTTPINSNKFVTTGGTTLAVTDLRRGVQSRSDDQETELLASAFVTGFSKRGTNVGSKIIAGDATGVLTLWEKGVWDDQDERIVVSRLLSKYKPLQTEGKLMSGEIDSVECLVNVPEIAGGDEKTIAVGLSSGLVAFIQVGSGKHEVLDVIRHHDVEGAEQVGFDVYGRVITGGGSCVKVWREKSSVNGDVEEEEEEWQDEEEDVDDASDEEEEESSESEEERRPKKKRKGSSSNKKMGSFKGLD
jgi:hypothetical protein